MGIGQVAGGGADRRGKIRGRDERRLFPCVAEHEERVGLRGVRPEIGMAPRERQRTPVVSREGNLQLIGEGVRERDAAAHAREPAGTEVARDAFDAFFLPSRFAQDAFEERDHPRVVRALNGTERAHRTIDAGDVPVVRREIDAEGPHGTSVGEMLGY